MFELGDRVIISENIFPGSGAPKDIAARGAHGEIVEDYRKTFGAGWAGCYAVQTDAGIIHVFSREIRKG